MKNLISGWPLFLLMLVTGTKAPGQISTSWQDPSPHRIASSSLPYPKPGFQKVKVPAKRSRRMSPCVTANQRNAHRVPAICWR